MRIYANGKVNVALDVVRRRPDGFHDLDMVMLPVDLADVMDIERLAHGPDEITADGMVLPENNTVSAALRVIRNKAKEVDPDYVPVYYRVHIQKNIPSQAGLGGGSADGAAMLKWVNQAEGLGFDEKTLAALGAMAGADVPFCVMNRPCRVKGKGELTEPFEMDWCVRCVLVKPEAGVSTPAAFRMWDEDPQVLHDVDLVQTALMDHDLELLYSTMQNALEPAAFALVPELERVRQDMSDAGLVRVMMTGSGSCLMGFSVDEDVLAGACEVLAGKYPFVRVVSAGGRL